MPFNVDLYPCLKRIIDETYSREIVHRLSIPGAHDCNWMKEYESFYNKQPNAAPYVTRIHFRFGEKRGKQAGFVNIRPISDGSEVSETYLVPPKRLTPENDSYVKCLGKHNAYGETVFCTPFIMPETVLGMCIQASIWISLKILQNRGTVEIAPSIPEIQILARGNPYADKEGLFFVQATRLLRMCQSAAFYINNKETPNLTDNQLLMELYAYVESGLPVILGVDVADLPWWRTSRHGYHSIVAIGHTMENNAVDGFIVHDESCLPYAVLKNDQLMSAWHVPGSTSPSSYVREMLIATPSKVSLPFHEAYHQFEELLGVFGRRGVTAETAGNLTIQPMLREIPQLFAEQQSGRSMLLGALREAEFPEYLWLFNMYLQGADRTDLRNAKGFFVRDATGKTELRYFYFKDEKQAVYQVENTVYRHREGRINREKL